MLDQTIQIIDDDADLLQLGSLIFEKNRSQGYYSPLWADDLGKFFTHHPNLIILEVMMPVQPRAGP